MGIEIRKNVVVDDKSFKEHLRAYSKIMGLAMGEVIRKQAGLFCMDMIEYTRPYSSEGDGSSKGAKERGQNLVASDIKHIFMPLEKASPAQVVAIGRYDVFKMWDKARWQGMGDAKGRKATWSRLQQTHAGGRAATFIESGDLGAMGALHSKLRTDGGHGPLMGYAKKAKNAFGIVQKAKDIEKYTKKKQKEVGVLKSAYWFAAENIKAKSRGPAWVKNPAGRSNSISEDAVDKPLHPEITVGNLIGLKGTKSSLVKTVLNRRALAMRSVMARQLEKDKIPLWKACADGKLPNPGAFFK